MLVELSIENLVLIERATLNFGAGLNAVTGETGAGKSLLIDALELLLGNRARSDRVRGGAEQARVEGRFVLALGSYGEHVASWLREHLPQTLDEHQADDELELILARTLTRDGRTRAHVNHRPVTAKVLRELAALLVEIHGQNDHQRLFETSEQLRLLDSFADLGDALAGYRERRARALELTRRRDDFESHEAERLGRIDLLRFQLAELERADPSVEERQSLLSEREILRNAEDLGRGLGDNLTELSEMEGAALDVLRRAERAVGAWEDKIQELAPPAAALRESTAQLEEAVSSLRSFLDAVERNPARLDEIESRLAELERLLRKHGTDLPGLVARRVEIEAELAELDGGEANREQLTEAAAQACAALEESAERLARGRKKHSGRLVQAVHGALRELGLANAVFSVTMRERKGGAEGGVDGYRRRFGPEGAHDFEFQLAANPGEQVSPLRKAASGGEMARVMLGLRCALAVRQSTPTLIFDEVDAGVGGRLGPAVGGHLRALAEHHQVLCVTHLPAIAAAAHHHLRVRKEVRRGRTRTHVGDLTADARVEEIADMIAGGGGTETARAEARRLLTEGDGT